MRTEPVIYDVCRYQIWDPGRKEHMDVDKFVSVAPVQEFNVCRATIADYYTDPHTSWFFDQMLEKKMPTTFYFVTNQKIDTNSARAAKKHLDYLDKAIYSRVNQIGCPLVLDVEIKGQNHKFNNDMIYRILKDGEQKYGHKFLIYTGSYAWDEIMGKKEWHREYELWMAWYAKVGESQKLPDELRMPSTFERKNLIMHQTTDKADGKAKGCTSYGLDLSRWVHESKTASEWMNDFNDNPTTPPDPPVDPPIEENCDQIENERDELQEILQQIKGLVC